MTTLLHLNQTITDIQETLNREQRFSQDACHNLMLGTKLVREALDALDRDIRAHFDERDRALARMLGNSYTATIDGPNVPPAVAPPASPTPAPAAAPAPTAKAAAE